MPLSHDEATAIKNEVIAECKNIFVQIDDCNDKQEKVNSKLANDDKRIEMGLRDIAGIKKLLWTIAASGLGTLVAAVLGLILK